MEFELLYDRFARRLHGWALRRTSGTADAEDLIQDTFLAIHVSQSRYRGESDVEAWVFGVARNVWRVAARARARLKRAAPRVPIDDASPLELSDEGQTPEASLDAGRAFARVAGAGGAALGQAEWDRLVAYALELTDLDELEQETGLSRVALKSRLSRSRRRLQQAFPEIEAS
jgi:RNA polymerase sigma factor (sigma-70 family)